MSFNAGCGVAKLISLAPPHARGTHMYPHAHTCALSVCGEADETKKATVRTASPPGSHFTAPPAPDRSADDGIPSLKHPITEASPLGCHWIAPKNWLGDSPAQPPLAF